MLKFLLEECSLDGVPEHCSGVHQLSLPLSDYSLPTSVGKDPQAWKVIRECGIFQPCISCSESGKDLGILAGQ